MTSLLDREIDCKITHITSSHMDAGAGAGRDLDAVSPPPVGPAVYLQRCEAGEDEWSLCDSG